MQLEPAEGIEGTRHGRCMRVLPATHACRMHAYGCHSHTSSIVPSSAGWWQLGGAAGRHVPHGIARDIVLPDRSARAVRIALEGQAWAGYSGSKTSLCSRKNCDAGLHHLALKPAPDVAAHWAMRRAGRMSQFVAVAVLIAGPGSRTSGTCHEQQSMQASVVGRAGAFQIP